jgi:hypothetical protein
VVEMGQKVGYRGVEGAVVKLKREEGRAEAEGAVAAAAGGRSCSVL